MHRQGKVTERANQSLDATDLLWAQVFKRQACH
jgi:hypothetical protein